MVHRLKVVSRHPYVIPVVTLFCLLAVTLGGYLLFKHHSAAKSAYVVIISHDHIEEVVPSRQPTVGVLLQKLNLRLHEGDVVEPSLSTRINQDRFRINIYRAVPVAIVDNGHQTFTFSASTTPRSIAQQAGTKLYPEDNVATEPVDNFLAEGAIGKRVIIDRATPVNVDLYGTPVVLRTHAATIGDLLKEKHLELAKSDQVVPAPNTPIVAGQQMALLRNGTKVETATEEIPMPVQTTDDPSLAYGTSAIRQQGSPGQQLVTYEISLTNNVETGRKVIQKVVSKAPVTQITVIGSSLSGIKGDMALAGIAASDYQYVDYIVSHESGWRPNAGSAGGPYGLCQAYPGSKMVSAGADWATNPITQLRWCSGYATGRYGSWAAAYNHWVSNRNW